MAEPPSSARMLVLLQCGADQSRDDWVAANAGWLSPDRHAVAVIRSGAIEAPADLTAEAPDRAPSLLLVEDAAIAANDWTDVVARARRLTGCVAATGRWIVEDRAGRPVDRMPQLLASSLSWRPVSARMHGHLVSHAPAKFLWLHEEVSWRFLAMLRAAGGMDHALRLLFHHLELNSLSSLYLPDLRVYEKRA